MTDLFISCAHLHWPPMLFTLLLLCRRLIAVKGRIREHAHNFYRVAGTNVTYCCLKENHCYVELVQWSSSQLILLCRQWGAAGLELEDVSGHPIGHGRLNQIWPTTSFNSQTTSGAGRLKQHLYNPRHQGSLNQVRSKDIQKAMLISS